jgi:glycosyltransferase involved in cell wall biosynthesis
MQRKIKVGFVTKSLTDGNAQRGVGFYAKRLLPVIKDQCSMFNIEIFEDKYDDVDIVHYPYFDLFYHTLPVFRKTKTVVTVHDVIPLEFPEVYKQGLKAKLNLYLQKLALSGVEGVITDSFYSLKNIRKYLNIPNEKLKPVYLAADEIFKPKKVTKKYNLPKEFVLYVGDINYNKNIPGLIEACKLTKLPLVMVGRQAKEIENMDLNHPELAHLKSLDLDYPLRLGFVADEDLVDIYNLASVYCQASFSEGFGLNPLEALACGTPVASSNRGSLPEVLGDNAVYFDPTDTKAISQAIMEAQKTPARNAFSIADAGGWDKTAKETLQVYKSLCQ